MRVCVCVCVRVCACVYICTFICRIISISRNDLNQVISWMWLSWMNLVFKRRFP